MADIKTIGQDVRLVKDLVDWSEFNTSVDSKRVIEWSCSMCKNTWKEMVNRRRKYSVCPQCRPRKAISRNPLPKDYLHTYMGKPQKIYVCSLIESHILLDLLTRWITYSQHHNMDCGRSCNYPSCTKRSSYGLPIPTYFNLYCSKHRLEGMYRSEKGCITGCGRRPKFGSVFSHRNRCEHHKFPEQVGITYNLVVLTSKGKYEPFAKIITTYISPICS